MKLKNNTLFQLFSIFETADDTYFQRPADPAGFIYLLSRHS